MSIKNSVDFDDYVENYEALLKNQLSLFSKDRDYFSLYKVEIAASYSHPFTKRILDFGGGIGLSLPHIREKFPNSDIFLTDISEKSIDYARKKYSFANIILDSDLDSYTFDLILVTCVFHHIPPDERSKVMQRLGRLLSKKGQLCIFEHNPFNPVTRYMVETCPFDVDAQLISHRALKLLMRENLTLESIKSGYTLFFPKILERLRPFEAFLKKVPLGGQYFLFGSC